MLNIFTLVLCGCMGVSACKKNDDPVPTPYEKLDKSNPSTLYHGLLNTAAQLNGTELKVFIDSVYNYAERQKWIPLTFQDTAVFIYKRNDTTDRTIMIYGDMSGWSTTNEPQIQLQKIAGTGLYHAIYKAPATNARLDYKIVDGGTWKLDPGNPRQAWGGFGPNSELAMPDYVYSDWVNVRASGNKGTLDANWTNIHSDSLNYNVQYKVYLPYGYNASKQYPLIISTDGQEYSDPRLGALNIVVDNMAMDGLINPPVIVFVDPRNPSNTGENRRMTELNCNDKYLAFLTEELYPFIRNEYSVSDQANQHIILGTSMGGLNAAFCAVKRPDIFGLAAIQSPAFWYNNVITTLYQNSSNLNVKFYMDAGTVYDTSDEARAMHAIWESKGYTSSYSEYPEAHSWGSWRARADDWLLYFFKK